MTFNTCFEPLSLVPFSTEKSFINNEQDPDVDFYNNIFTLGTQYHTPDKFQRNFKDKLKAFDEFKNKQQKCMKYSFLICKSIYILKVYSVHYTST